jgi:DNA-binding NtrC family response regulator
MLVGEQYDGPIHLLLTDVVMPHLGGRQLAARLTQARPAMRVLYMSGYAQDTVSLGVGELGIAFLAKPITPDALLRKVRQVLDGR